VKIITPALEEPLEGHVYLAQPPCGGAAQPVCTEALAEVGGLFGAYIEAQGSGVNVKLKGSVEVGGSGVHSGETGLAPGQVRVRFASNPQLPFSDLRVSLHGGPRAPLANPSADSTSCGVERAVTYADLVPWSSPTTPDATPSWPTTITGCSSPSAFAPSFAAGTTVPLGGASTPFVLSLSRSDGQQDLSSIAVKLPPGLLGKIASVTPCPEPQASAGGCGAESLLGHVAVAAGSGSQPVVVEGSVYLTVSYSGAPFGLTIVVPAVAGPFNLGNVVVRAAITVDRSTAAVSVQSDSFPQLVDGVPLRVKTVNMTLDRPQFMLNPTNCAAQQITATITGAAGTPAGVSSPFAVTGCKNLPFAPRLTALTTAKASKANGAYLHVKVTSGAGQSNIRTVRVALPKQLPSRLTTLQKACLARVFNANPASCPAGSNVGTATARTPLLKAPLTGPAYLVSNGAAKFPDLEVILQGEGITLVLDGNTDIKKGITTSTFKTVPDAPVASFDLVLPQGPHSVFASFGSLCQKALLMPTTITGQNGRVVTQNTKIAASGCKSHKKTGRHKAKNKRR
jgi:hypothetical protein